MAIVVSLSPELEVRLRKKAAQQGQDVSFVAAQLLEAVLEWEVQDSEAAIKGIQQGLEDFEAGRFCSFDDFADERRRKYNLPADS
jgi:predicted transcriptional regulator